MAELFDEYNIKPVPLSHRSPTTYSYCHETLQHYSLIDNFCVSGGLISVVPDMSTVDVDNNISDHLPVEVRSMSFFPRWYAPAVPPEFGGTKQIWGTR